MWRLKLMQWYIYFLGLLLDYIDQPRCTRSKYGQIWRTGSAIHRDGDLPAIISDDGNQYWYRYGQQHRDGDRPAVIMADGSQSWYREGKLHRDGDQPADISNYSKVWAQYGMKHREGDQPAEISDSCQIWYRYGYRYRVAGQAHVVWSNGIQEWHELKDKCQTKPNWYDATDYVMHTSMYNDGCICHYKKGKLHTDDDVPAVIQPDGSKEWFRHGKLHRDGDKPAIVRPHGDMYWYQNGRLHRDGGPAIVYANGSEEWYQHGQLHRDGDMPASITAGLSSWYQHGELHRDGDQPAWIWHNSGERMWYKNGKLHRVGGPAVCNLMGVAGINQYFFEGYSLTKEQSQWIDNYKYEKTKRFIISRLFPKLYDPRTKSGQRRMHDPLNDIATEVVE